MVERRDSIECGSDCGQRGEAMKTVAGTEDGQTGRATKAGAIGRYK